MWVFCVAEDDSLEDKYERENETHMCCVWVCVRERDIDGRKSNWDRQTEIEKRKERGTDWEIERHRERKKQKQRGSEKERQERERGRERDR